MSCKMARSGNVDSSLWIAKFVLHCVFFMNQSAESVYHLLKVNQNTLVMSLHNL